MSFRFDQTPGLRKEIKKLIGQRLTGLKMANLARKAGDPDDDSDIAVANGDLCLDTTNEELYVASNVTDSTTTWTKIVD